MEPNIIARVACKHFNSLPKKGKPTPTEWTTLAAIIQETTCGNVSDYKVVALATGTKCLGKNELSQFGDVVSDCHAEVVARRSFLLYLYEELDICRLGQWDKTIFKLIQETNEQNLINNLRLCDSVKFHMFISHLPCGDAAIICNTETIESIPDANLDSMDSFEPPKKKLKSEGCISFQNDHRTGAKLQVGPLQFEETQMVGQCRVKPGKGDPTLCMSCSDKLGKWQILGLQGSLLSVFIPVPIRLQSITIGNGMPFSHESLERSIFARFVNSVAVAISEKSPEYLTDYKCPRIEQADTNFMVFTNKLVAAPGSISWFLSSRLLDLKETVQVIIGGRKQGATKKYFGKPATMVSICRANLLSKFKKLYLTQSLDVAEFNIEDANYSKIKELSTNYEEIWNFLQQNVFFGWTKKPPELKLFS